MHELCEEIGNHLLSVSHDSGDSGLLLGLKPVPR